ncbi:MAG: VacJ family lipoprotein [Methylococcaceae bacterium]
MRTFKINVLMGSCLLSVLSGCTTLAAKDARDPLESWNRDVQVFNDKVDEYALKPIAQGYQFIMPAFADTAVTNFFSNLDDIGVALNDFMQLKFEQGGLDSARFLVNSVAGVGGVMDVAADLDLPKHDEDFDQTLGVWGVPMGPYVVLPFLGPNSVRGIGGKIGDAGLNPLIYLGYGVIPTGLSSASEGIISSVLGALKVIDTRADLLSTEKIADEAAIDRYDFFKNSYLQRRNYLVNDGKVAEENTDFDESDLDAEPKSESKSLKPQ